MKKQHGSSTASGQSPATRSLVSILVIDLDRGRARQDPKRKQERKHGGVFNSENDLSVYASSRW